MKRLYGFAVAAAVAGFASVAIAEEAASTPVPVTGGAATLSPSNTKVTFVGTHQKPKEPDPRIGTFDKFTGKAEVDAAAKTLKSISVEFDATSISTQFDKLTNHLKSPDFFDVREYPKASFKSTGIAAGKDGEVNVKGELTLHGKTKEVAFPLKASVSDKGVTATGKFKIKQSDFGMDKMLAGVVDEVELTVAIGQKNELPKGPPAAGK